MSLESIYQELTGVDLAQQKTLWDERGRGYYGEYQVFKALYPNLPGNCKILMNLQIPAGHNRTTEIDLLLIHETGFYVFEVKHFKGTIYGKESDLRWTQYFRTTKNSYFQNPILQNQYHIKALRKLFPEIPVHSFIVFTNPECELRSDRHTFGVTIGTLSALRSMLQILPVRPKVFDMEMIDRVFERLLPFAPIMERTVPVGQKMVPLNQYINTMAEDLQNAKASIRASYDATIKKERRRAIAAIVLAGVLFLICFVLLICLLARW